MEERFLAVDRFFFGKADMSLRRRVLRLTFLGSAIIFFAVSAIFGGILYVMQDIVIDEGAKLGQSAADYAEDFLKEKAKERIMEVVASQSRYVESVMGETREDVMYLADCAGRLSESSRPPALSLPDSRKDVIKEGEAYIHYGRLLRERGIDDDTAAQVSLMSHAVDFLVPVADVYKEDDASIYIAPKEGYLICVDTTRDSDVVEMTEEFLTEYEPTERPWYQLALKEGRSGKPVFTDVYRGANGLPSATCTMPYYKDGAFAGVVGIGCTLEWIAEMVESATIGETGFSFVLDKSGNIIFSGKKENAPDLKNEHGDGLNAAMREMVEGKSGIRLVSISGDDYFIAFSPMRSVGWSFATLISSNEIIEPARMLRENLLRQVDDFDDVMVRALALTLLGLAFLLLLILLALSPMGAKMARRFTDPLYALEGGVREIAEGNLDYRLDVKTGNELEILSDDVNLMAAKLKEYMEHLAAVTSERERIKTELALAASIQAGMLPSVRPDFFGKGSYSLAASMQTAKEVGGDFYDFYMLPGNRLAVTIADVSGKGIGASLFMVVSKTVLKETMLSAAARAGGGEPDYAAAMEAANRRLCEGNEEDMFVTVFFGVLDLASGDFAYVNGGHNPPLIGRGGGFEYLRMKKKSAMLGVIEFEKYHEHHAKLSAGDMIFLYTDGVTEAMDERGEEYTEERLRERLIACRDMDVDGLLAAVREDVAAHAGGAAQSDDITMMALKYLGRKQSE